MMLLLIHSYLEMPHKSSKTRFVFEMRFVVIRLHHEMSMSSA